MTRLCKYFYNSRELPEVAKNKIIIKTGALAPIEVESLFDKRPNFS
jgi:hypothetical protein